jgi:eukaryotic-like serine/threonine-protein kinase
MANSTELRQLEPGTVFAGKYRVERVLGAGGMGVVLEATHLLLSERVAIKLLLPHVLGNPEHHSRFLREAQAAARINSPYVGKVRDVGVLDTDEPYIVMDFLEGPNLEALVARETKLDVCLTATLLLQACEGLAAAHAAGVIHRDIKPSNLLVCKAADGSPQLKLLDFGISKLMASGSTSEVALTGTQVSMGSPLSMSPEQMLSARDVDNRTDIWSLGVVLYYCLSGALPFQATTLPQLCVMVLEAEIVPLTSTVPELPLALVRIIEKCLKKAPAERFQNVAELALALAPFAGSTGMAAAERCQRILGQTCGASKSPSGDIQQNPEPTLGTIPSVTGTAFGRTALQSIRPAPRLGLLALVVALGVGVAIFLVLSLTQTPSAPVTAATGTALESVQRPASTELVTLPPGIPAEPAPLTSASPTTMPEGTSAPPIPRGASARPKPRTVAAPSASIDPFSLRK